MRDMYPYAQVAKIAKILGGIPVWEVFPGSAAEAAGIKLGDVIVCVNGVRTPTFQHFLDAGQAHLEHLEFDVFRNGRLLRLTASESADPI
jgi:predicted metalloprotease with PDZ domain